MTMNKLLIGLLLLVPQDTLKVNVSLVTVGVRVSDSKGRSVLGLKQEDFSIFEDGVRQQVEFFSSEEQPITLGILLDRSFSMSFKNKLDRAKEAAHVLVRSARDGSEYFYFTFDDQVKLAADFTKNRDALHSAIDRTTLGGGTSLYDAIAEGLALCNRATLPRQALVIISDGADQHSRRELQEVMQIVRQAEMQIFTIGYFSPDEDKNFSTSGPKIQMTDGRTIDNPRDVLQRVARESGAESYFPRNDVELAKAIEDITNDLKTQYTLAYYPPAGSGQSIYHQLRVNVRRRYNVRARPGYGTPDLQPAVVRRTDSRAFEARVRRKDGRTLYEDNFSNPNSGWPNRVSAAYEREGYRLNGDNVVAVNGPAFKNFEASVQMTSTNGGGGLVFRQNDRGYYAFAVYPDFATVNRVEPIKTTELAQWPLTAPPGFRQTLEVRCQATECGFYQQGRLLGRTKDNAFAEGRIGLHVNAKSNALFKDLHVEEVR
jgi:Ca-activated chloride channel homolog